jgi:hypothetical protein
MTRAAPWLSVVVAARHDERDARDCLAALTPQLDDGIELILAADRQPAASDGAVHEAVIVKEGLIPELWAAGIARARGEYVGLLASTVIPSPNWIARTRALHERDIAAIGGPIEPSAGLRLTDWAVYLCRYSPYMRPLAGANGLDIAADNASYRRATLQHCEQQWKDGFLEPFVHAALRAHGDRVEVIDDRVVRHVGGAPFTHFLRQRYEHGRAHARREAQRLPRASTVVRFLQAPLVPFVMTTRVARRVLQKRRGRRRFATASPLVFLCFCAWATGESRGYLAALAGRHRP